jgi:hypothetical protein
MVPVSTAAGILEPTSYPKLQEKKGRACNPASFLFKGFYNNET